MPVHVKIEHTKVFECFNITYFEITILKSIWDFYAMSELLVILLIIKLGDSNNSFK